MTVNGEAMLEVSEKGFAPRFDAADAMPSQRLGVLPQSRNTEAHLIYCLANEHIRDSIGCSTYFWSFRHFSPCMSAIEYGPRLGTVLVGPCFVHALRIAEVGQAAYY
jgi:hypothetical protein